MCASMPDSILPGEEWWENNFPFAARHAWARPPFLVFRYLRAAVSPDRRKRIAAELRTLGRTIEERKNEEESL